MGKKLTIALLCAVVCAEIIGIGYVSFFYRPKPSGNGKVTIYHNYTYYNDKK